MTQREKQAEAQMNYRNSQLEAQMNYRNSQLELQKERNRIAMLAAMNPAQGASVTVHTGEKPSLTDLTDQDSAKAKAAFRDNLTSLPKLLQLQADFEPEYFTRLFQIKQQFTEQLDKINPDALSDQQRQDLAKYTAYQNLVDQNFNAYKNLITGSAGSPVELKDIKNSIFNMDQSPTAFQASLKQFQENIARELRGAIYLQATGVANLGTQEMGDEIARRSSANFIGDRYEEAVGDYLMASMFGNNAGEFDVDSATEEQRRAVAEQLLMLGFPPSQ